MRTPRQIIGDDKYEQLIFEGYVVVPANADALEDQADTMRQEAFDRRPLPDVWRVGQKVRYLEDKDWAWSAGGEATIIEIMKEYEGKPAKEYAVFWTSSDNGKTHRFWTTPSDVELVEDVV